MRFSILLITMMALWILPTYGQTLTAPTSVNLPQKRGAFDLPVPKFSDKPTEPGWTEPCFCPETEPQCAPYYAKRPGWFKLPVNSLKLPNHKTLALPEIQVIDFEGLKKLLAREPNDARPMLVNFWATWCDPCREEFPDLVKIDEDYTSKKLNFVTISLDEVSELKAEVPKFLKEMKASMPTVLLNVSDPEPAIKLIDTAWDGQLPATFLYDKDGKVVFKHFGRFNTGELRAAIEKAVGSKQ